MTTKETMMQNNKLIAEFIGMVYDNHNNQPNKYWELTDEQNFVSPKPYPQDKDLKFHSDWNWLMEVVEKIECCDFIFSIHHEVANIFNGECNELTYNETTQARTKIEAVYNACLEFIKWYNENKIQTRLKNNLD